MRHILILLPACVLAGFVFVIFESVYYDAERWRIIEHLSRVYAFYQQDKGDALLPVMGVFSVLYGFFISLNRGYNAIRIFEVAVLFASILALAYLVVALNTDAKTIDIVTGHYTEQFDFENLTDLLALIILGAAAWIGVLLKDLIGQGNVRNE